MRTLIRYVCLAALVSTLQLRAQSTFGSIVGTVKDATGAVLTDASVKVTLTDENATSEFSTNGNGNYEALNLKPGHYKVTVDHPGFQEKAVENLLLQARQTSRVDVNLAVGSTQQTVTVESQGGVIASETDTIASTYGSEKILTLPTNLRASTSTSPYGPLTTHFRACSWMAEPTIIFRSRVGCRISLNLRSMASLRRASGRTGHWSRSFPQWKGSLK